MENLSITDLRKILKYANESGTLEQKVPRSKKDLISSIKRAFAIFRTKHDDTILVLQVFYKPGKASRKAAFKIDGQQDSTPYKLREGTFFTGSKNNLISSPA